LPITIVGLLRQRNKVGTYTLAVSNKYYSKAKLKYMSFPFVCRIFTGFGFTEVEYNRRLANSFIEIIINIIETINII